eukprot:6214421-Pleurochrysis_carterae.AAC.2
MFIVASLHFRPSRRSQILGWTMRERGHPIATLPATNGKMRCSWRIPQTLRIPRACNGRTPRTISRSNSCLQQVRTNRKADGPRRWRLALRPEGLIASDAVHPPDRPRGDDVRIRRTYSTALGGGQGRAGDAAAATSRSQHPHSIS